MLTGSSVDASPLPSPLRTLQGNAAVRTQLCLAIAALAAHLPAVQWGPQGVVGWLAQRLGGEPQTVSLPCMLELLTVLPQVGAPCRGKSQLECKTESSLFGSSQNGHAPCLPACGKFGVGEPKLWQQVTRLNTCLTPPLRHGCCRRRAATSRQCGRSGGGRSRTRCWPTRRRHAGWCKRY